MNKEFCRLVNQRLSSRYKVSNCQNKEFTGLIIEETPQNLMATLRDIRQKFEFIFLIDIVGIDNLNRECEKRFSIYYILLNFEGPLRLSIRMDFDEGQAIPSIEEEYICARWPEREVQELLGITFSNKKYDRLLTGKGMVGFPLRKDFQTAPYLENQVVIEKAQLFKETEDFLPTKILGPEHSITSGEMKMTIRLEEEKVKSADLEIGYSHRGIEKQMESLTFQQIIPLTDRLNSASGSINNIGWCKAVEEFIGITPNDKVKAMRMVFIELGRISDHLLTIGKMGQSLGISLVAGKCNNLRQLILELFERYCGSRITVSLSKIGGMAYDFPPHWIQDCLATIDSFGRDYDEINKLITRSQIWMERTQVGRLASKLAIEGGVTGPCLRACGVNYDIRKNMPYYFYDEVDFDIPLGINGDSYDRYLVRMEEIRQSTRILIQVLDNMPVGAIETEWDKKSIIDKGCLYSSSEASNGELGYFIMSEGNGTPYRVKIRPPSLYHCQSLNNIVSGYEFRDISPILCSLNIVSGEMDR